MRYTKWMALAVVALGAGMFGVAKAQEPQPEGPGNAPQYYQDAPGPGQQAPPQGYRGPRQAFGDIHSVRADMRMHRMQLRQDFQQGRPRAAARDAAAIARDRRVLRQQFGVQGRRGMGPAGGDPGAGAQGF